MKPAAATRPRKHARQSNAFLTRTQIQAVGKLHKAGVPLTFIARQGWHKWGYASQSSCLQALHKALKLDALITPTPTCKRCRVPYDQRTPGCPACRYRHLKRSRLGQPAILLKAGQRASCKTCGCPIDHYTTGCITCRWRRNWRQRQGEQCDTVLPVIHP